MSFFYGTEGKESASSSEAFLPVPVGILGTAVHFFFFLKQPHPRVHCSVHCAPVIHNDSLCFLSLVLMIVVPSLLWNPVAPSLILSGVQFLVAA